MSVSPNANMFPEFLYHPHLFALHQTMWKHKPTTYESLGACWREVVWTCCNMQSRVIHVWLTVLCRLLARAQCVIVTEVHSVCSTINMPKKCVNSSDAFCYICGEVAFKSQRRSFTRLIKKCYAHYFGCKVGDQDKSGAPHFCCVTCATLLAAWAKGSRCMPFAIPMVWRQPTTMFQIATSAWQIPLV